MLPYSILILWRSDSCCRGEGSSSLSKNILTCGEQNKKGGVFVTDEPAFYFSWMQGSTFLLDDLSDDCYICWYLEIQPLNELLLSSQSLLLRMAHYQKYDSSHSWETVMYNDSWELLETLRTEKAN